MTTALDLCVTAVNPEQIASHGQGLETWVTLSKVSPGKALERNLGAWFEYATADSSTILYAICGSYSGRTWPHFFGSIIFLCYRAFVEQRALLHDISNQQDTIDNGRPHSRTRGWHKLHNLCNHYSRLVSSCSNIEEGKHTQVLFFATFRVPLRTEKSDL